MMVPRGTCCAAGRLAFAGAGGRGSVGGRPHPPGDGAVAVGPWRRDGRQLGGAQGRGLEDALAANAPAALFAAEKRKRNGALTKRLAASVRLVRTRPNEAAFFIGLRPCASSGKTPGIHLGHRVRRNESGKRPPG
jgi:hypothetical protein